mmetsp:Transcript_1581/g.1068  ORF Transcript_1581/g.1068 Transcript_1581/m.1068 type:complete len:180 (+) Transcript_1581:129-668(+)
MKQRFAETDQIALHFEGNPKKVKLLPKRVYYSLPNSMVPVMVTTYLGYVPAKARKSKSSDSSSSSSAFSSSSDGSSRYLPDSDDQDPDQEPEALGDIDHSFSERQRDSSMDSNRSQRSDESSSESEKSMSVMTGQARNFRQFKINKIKIGQDSSSHQEIIQKRAHFNYEALYLDDSKIG